MGAVTKSPSGNMQAVGNANYPPWEPASPCAVLLQGPGFRGPGFGALG